MFINPHLSRPMRPFCGMSLGCNMKLILVCTTMQTNWMQTYDSKLLEMRTYFLWTIPTAPSLVRWDELAVTWSANLSVHVWANVICPHLSTLMTPLCKVSLVCIMKLILICTNTWTYGMQTNDCKLFDMWTNFLWTLTGVTGWVWSKWVRKPFSSPRS